MVTKTARKDSARGQRQSRGEEKPFPMAGLQSWQSWVVNARCPVLFHAGHHFVERNTAGAFCRLHLAPVRGKKTAQTGCWRIVAVGVM
jgi:hypothetical protein